MPNPPRGIEKMTPERLTAFSDGVIAVIITVMVLELKVPSREALPSDWAALHVNFKLMLLYLLSFIQVGIYWVNHHYLLHDVEVVGHRELWFNLAVLFFISLFPFATSWLGERGVNSFSVALYSIVSFLPAVAWIPMARLVRQPGQPPVNDPKKEWTTAALYLAAIGTSFPAPRVAIGILCVVALFWVLPPTRVLAKRHTR